MTQDIPLIYPTYFRVARREGNTWHFWQSSVFYNPHNSPALTNEEGETHYGVSKAKMAIEFFRINGGKPGFYLANIRDKQYYYCGANKEDVRAKLVELGVRSPL